jgi:mono/diheme cytochrome c family protein
MTFFSLLSGGWGRVALPGLMAFALVACHDQPPEDVPREDDASAPVSAEGVPREDDASAPVSAEGVPREDDASAPVSAETIAAGMELYLDNGCGLCHGRDGSGSGPLAHTIEPRPRDYRDPSAYKQGTSVAEIAYSIAAGVGGATSKMPKYPHLSERERTLIAEYIVSLQNR